MKFNQLSIELQQTVIEKHRYFNVDDSFWSDMIIEDFKEALEQIGFNSVVISYSGFYSQGDGASFVCSNIDLEKFLRSQKCFSKYRRYVPDADRGLDYEMYVCRIGSHYVHEKSVSVDSSVWHAQTENQLSKISEIEEIVSDFVLGKCQEIYKALEELFEDLTSDEYIKESLIANDYYDFDSFGNII